MKIPNSNFASIKGFFSLLFLACGFLNTAHSGTINISVGDLSFSPDRVYAGVGDKIRWTWYGTEDNSVVCDGILPGTLIPTGAAGWHCILNANNPVFEYTVTVTGAYKYASDSKKMWGLIIVESSLPVELIDFVATTIKNEVILDWSTGEEVNNDRFEIQRVELNKIKDDPEEVEFITVGILGGNGTINFSHNYRFKDCNLKSGTYLYRLRQIDFNSNYIYHLLNGEIIVGVPSKFSISQNYPNPFNPVTKVNYELPYDGFVKIFLIDATGKLVSTLVDDNMSAGYQTLELNGSALSSGAYFYRIEYSNSVDFQSVTKKMILIK